MCRLLLYDYIPINTITLKEPNPVLQEKIVANARLNVVTELMEYLQTIGLMASNLTPKPCVI